MTLRCQIFINIQKLWLKMHSNGSKLRSYQVKNVEGLVTRSVQVKSSIPQRSILKQMLFNLYFKNAFMNNLMLMMYSVFQSLIIFQLIL